VAKRIVEIPLDDQHRILAEIDEHDYVEDDALTPASRMSPDSIEQVAGSVQDAIDCAVTPTANAIFRRLTSMPSSPQAVELEFGLKFNAKAGVVFASTEMEGHIKVTLSWNRS
jgi:hypothetical protein